MFRLGTAELVFLGMTMICAYGHSYMFFPWLALTLWLAHVPAEERRREQLAYVLIRRRRR